MFTDEYGNFSFESLAFWDGSAAHFGKHWDGHLFIRRGGRRGSGQKRGACVVKECLSLSLGEKWPKTGEKKGATRTKLHFNTSPLFLLLPLHLLLLQKRGKNRRKMRVPASKLKAIAALNTSIRNALQNENKKPAIS